MRFAMNVPFLSRHGGFVFHSCGNIIRQLPMLLVIVVRALAGWTLGCITNAATQIAAAGQKWLNEKVASSITVRATF